MTKIWCIWAPKPLNREEYTPQPGPYTNFQVPELEISEEQHIRQDPYLAYLQK